MSTIENSGANPAYQPSPPGDPQLTAQPLRLLADLEAEALRAHRRLLHDSAEDWSPAAHVPITYTAAVAGAGGPSVVRVDGLLVSFTVAAKRATRSPAKIAASWDAFRRAVAGTRITGLHQTRIEPRLPEQVTSAHWATDRGDVTLANPERARHRKPRRRFTAFGAIGAGVWAILHGKIPVGPLGAAAGIAAVAMVPALPSPATPPARPMPGHTREVFVPARAGTTPASGPKVHPSPTSRRLSAPAPSQAGTTSTGSPREPSTAVTLPTITVTVPVVSTPAPAASVSAPAAPKVTAPPLPKTVKRLTQRRCVTVHVPLLHKDVTTCKRA